MTCNKCGEEKSGENFYDSHPSRCKDCCIREQAKHKKERAKRRLRNREFRLPPRPVTRAESQLRLFEKASMPGVKVVNGSFIHQPCKTPLQTLWMLDRTVRFAFCLACIEHVVFNEEVATRCRKAS